MRLRGMNTWKKNKSGRGACPPLLIYLFQSFRGVDPAAGYGFTFERDDWIG